MAAVEGLESHDNAQLYSDLGLGIEKLHVPYAASNAKVRGAVAEAFQHLRTLWHPNISCYTDILRLDGSNYILVSEQYSVSLDDLLDSCHDSSRYNENKLDVYNIDLFNVVHQIVTGIQYLHLHGIEHGSLGTHNVFLDSNGTVKIGCYASEYLRRIALHVIDETAADECPNQPDANSKPYPGIVQRPSDFEMLSKCFSAPELLNRKKQLSYYESMKNDTWSIGMICLQVINALITKRTIETSGNKCASTKLYRDITSMARCSKSRPIVQDAFAITAKLISVACSNMEKSQSLLGLNVEQMCIDAMKLDIPENELNCRSKIAHLIDALLERYTDLVLQVQCNHDKHVDPLLIASISSEYAEETRTNDINRYDPVDPDKHQASADGGIHGNINQIHEHPGSTADRNVPVNQNDQRFVINNDVEFSHSGNHVDHREPDKISQDDSYKQYRKLIETAVGILIDWFTSSSLIANMVSFLGIDLDQGSCEPTREHNADVHLIYTLFNMANTCLVVSTEARPRAVDLLLLFQRVNTKSLSHEAPYMWKVTSYHWADNKTNNVGRMTIDYFIERKHRKLCLEETNKRIIPIHVDDLFYFWRLMGNNPIDAISDLDCDPYVVNYQYEFVELIKLLDIMKQADLFPMIIEHQIRPTFAYARQFSFLYQWIRYRRFEKLLFNASESIQQISTEALLDVPPVLRRYIWCVILQVDTNVKPPMSYIEPCYTDTNLEYEIYKVFKRFNNDLLESKRAMQMMVHAIVAIRVTYEIDCLQNSIYATFVPFLLLYYEYFDIFMQVVFKVFDKYLKHYYINSGSFVNNELDEFGTMLIFFDPQLAVHLQQLGAYPDAFALPWFMSIFAEIASTQQLYMLYDTVLNYPRNFVKYIAIGILHSAREGILQICDAPRALSYITSILDTINIPMLNSVCSHMYNTWDSLLFSAQERRPKLIRTSSIQTPVTPYCDEPNISTLETTTFTFNLETCPKYRCFTVDLSQNLGLLEKCLVVDLRPMESYKSGHLPNSCHIDHLLQWLEKRELTHINELVEDIVSDSVTISSDLYINKMRKRIQMAKMCEVLLKRTSAPWPQERLREQAILLAAGDGTELDREMELIQRLVLDFHVPQLCYYRINPEDWLKFLTTAQV